MILLYLWLAFAILAVILAVDITYVKKWNVSWGVDWSSADWRRMRRRWYLLPLQLAALALIFPFWVLVVYSTGGSK